MEFTIANTTVKKKEKKEVLKLSDFKATVIKTVFHRYKARSVENNRESRHKSYMYDQIILTRCQQMSML